MQDLIHHGKIMHWGVSQWSAAQIAEASSKCKANGWIPPAVDQPAYSLLDRSVETSVLPVCEKHNIGVAAFSPLAQGILTGKYNDGSRPADSRGANDQLNMFMRETLSKEEALAKVRRLSELAKQCGRSTASIALAALLRREEVSTLIVGARTPEQLEQNVAASGIELPTEISEEIDDLFEPAGPPRQWV
jgi:aryl-alcohol dehydrogenase-like predicted oxidoreductase